MKKKIRIVFAVYHDTNTNGRAQQILHCAEAIGNTTLVSFRPVETWETDKNTRVVVTGKGKRKYLKFIAEAKRTIRKERPDIVILHDNYCATLIPFIYKVRPRPFIVYDSSELYIDKTFKSDAKFYLIQRQENKHLRKADFIIAANKERASLMKAFFTLSETPYVFENIRNIEDAINIEECENKFGKYLGDDSFIVLYAGGIAKNRMTYNIIRTVKKLGKGYKLLISGRKEENEEDLYQDALNSSSVDNVFYLGYLKRSELKYLFKNVDLSVSMFEQTTLNNINCASGKLHESLFEGCPVLTSTNPPLQRMCTEYGIGVSTEDLAAGIVEIKKHTDLYKGNINRYLSTLDLKQNLENLSFAILNRYGEYLNEKQS